MAKRLVEDVWVELRYTTVQLGVNGKFVGSGTKRIWLSEVPAWMQANRDVSVEEVFVLPDLASLLEAPAG